MEELARSFKALSHENRLHIIQLLMQKEYACCNVDKEDDCSLEEPECNFGELVDILGIHKSTLSHHLKELRYAGLIDTVKEGRFVSVRVNRERIRQLQDFFDLSSVIKSAS
jgi:DNA-binding transcriptional ArsR family regulator